MLLVITVPSFVLLALAGLTDNRAVLIAALIWVATTSLVRGVHCLLNIELFSICRLLAAFTVAFQLGGAVPAHIEYLLTGDLASYAALSVPEPSMAIASYVYVAIYYLACQLFCEFLSAYDRKWWQGAMASLDRNIKRDKHLVTLDTALLLAIGALGAWAVLTGQVGINKMYFEGGADGSNSIFASLLAITPQFAVGLAAALCIRFRSSWFKLAIIVVLTLPSLLMLFSLGRRPLIFAVVAGATIVLWQLRRRIPVSAVLAFIIAGAPALQVVSSFFQATRTAYHESGGRSEQRSLIDALSAGNESYAQAAERAFGDFTVRANSISFIVEIAELMQPEHFTLGWLSFGAFLRNIPSALWPGKVEFTAEFDKPDFYLMRMLGIEIYDAIMPIPALGYAEFGWFGVPASGLSVLALSWCLCWLSGVGRTVAAPAIAIAAAINFAFNIEADLTSAISTIRTVAMITLPLAVAAVLYRGRVTTATAT